MNYIGSKLSLLEFLEESINKVVNPEKNGADKNCDTFCDLFAGTGIVGSYFKKKGYKIIANDIQYYSYVLNRHYIGNHKELFFSKLLKEIFELKNIEIKDRKNFVCNYLSSLKGKKGFIYKNHCLGGTKGKKEVRQYFSDENGLMTLDDIKEIMSLKGEYGHFTKDYNRFKADKTENRDYKASKTVEYLHSIVCD